MKILLLNDNPVVNKLVTLSAQKTSDEVDIASNTEGIESQNYDLLIVDDSVYSDDLLNELNSKIEYKKSLFICAKDAQEPESFSSILKKPFLPTDLVELFMMLEKELEKEAQSETDEVVDEEVHELESNDDLVLDDDLDLDEELNLDDELGLEDELGLDDEEESFGESVLDDEEAQKVKDLLDENEEELSFEEEVQNDIESLELDELELDELELGEEEVSLGEEPIAEAEEEDILAAYDMALDLEDEADADISQDDNFELEDEVEALESEELEEIENELKAEEGDLAFDMALDLEDEADADISDDIIDDLNLENDEELEQLENVEEEPIEDEEIEEAEKVEEIEETAALEEPEESEVPEEVQEVEELETATVEELVEPEEELSDTDLEDKIQSAVENLTQEDLESELDEDTLLQIATNEIDPLADLTSKDLKVALGEEVEEVEDIDTPEVVKLEEATGEIQEQNSGVDALKKLLEALSDKDIAASMKGAKISINITLGDN